MGEYHPSGRAKAHPAARGRVAAMDWKAGFWSDETKRPHADDGEGRWDRDGKNGQRHAITPPETKG